MAGHVDRFQLPDQEDETAVHRSTINRRIMPLLNKLHLTAICFLLCFGVSRAQDPSSVDIDLRQSTVDPAKLEVYLRANGAFFNEVFSGLTFTVRWVTTSTATLGTRVNVCPSGISVAPTTQVTNPDVNGNPTGFNYRSFNAFGTSLLSDEGCPLPQDTWFLVTTIPVENNTGCTDFQIVNDEFTSSPGNARDFFVSLGGVEKTGVIEPTVANMGACAPDCLGVPGGSALPGTPCDDGNPDTFGETYTVDCICLAINTGVAELSSVPFSVVPNPTSGIVMIKVPSSMVGAHPFSITVQDASGKVVYTRSGPGLTSRELQFDLSAFSSGAYTIDLVIDGERGARRIVKH